MTRYEQVIFAKSLIVESSWDHQIISQMLSKRFNCISSYCFVLAVDVRGTPQTNANHPAIPTEVVIQLHNLQFVEGMTLEDAVTVIRGSFVPDGYEPYPFRKATPESLLDKLRSIVATFAYRHTTKELQQEGVDFTLHLYVPEVDPHTGEERHDRGDHNDIYKRIAQHLQNGSYDYLLKKLE